VSFLAFLVRRGCNARFMLHTRRLVESFNSSGLAGCLILLSVQLVWMMQSQPDREGVNLQIKLQVQIITFLVGFRKAINLQIKDSGWWECDAVLANG